MTPLDRALIAAKRAGMPPDQIARFLRAGYVPQPKQMLFHALARQADQPGAADRIALGGARGPGKSHAIMAQVAIDDLQRFPGLTALFLRKIGKAARESMDRLRSNTFIRLPHDYNRNEGIIRFPNGSRIILGNFRNPDDIDKYQGVEFDILVIEEYTQIPQKRIEMLEGSLRTNRSDYRPREYNSANPGGIGHQEFKKTYVDPHRQQRENGRYRFIPATYKDNKFLDAGYVQYLLELTGLLGRMWRDGDWDVGAGMFFTNWSHDTHVIQPRRIPANWPIWGSFDYGFSHPTAAYWWTADGDGNFYTIAEHHQPRWLVPQHAQTMHDIAANLQRPMPDFLAGHDVFAQKGDEQGKTIADQYAENGIRLYRANINRISGAAEMLKRLGNPEARLNPTWFIFSTCPVLIDTIPAMLSDPHRPEDVLKIDADIEGNGGDDPYDAARYGIWGPSRLSRRTPQNAISSYTTM
ncbi:MAG: hypothetical protein H6661_03085 [Ardenticatenaceae bacterium]|nr:hypothetical protein [Ardenticatenaceae bacterium]